MRGARIEAAIGAARQPRDLAERLFGDRVVALLEHEGRHAEQPELAGRCARSSIALLHGVADIDQRLHLARLESRAWHGQAPCGSACGRRGSRSAPSASPSRRRARPSARRGIRQPAEIDQLDVEPADRAPPRGTSRACSRQAVSQVGCRLMVASSAKISRPRLPGSAVGREPLHLGQEGVDLRARGRRCRRAAALGRSVVVAIVGHGASLGGANPRIKWPWGPRARAGAVAVGGRALREQPSPRGWLESLSICQLRSACGSKNAVSNSSVYLSASRPPIVDEVLGAISSAA